VAAIGLLSCLIVTWSQVLYWQNSLILWSRASDVTKDNWIAHYNLGLAFRRVAALENAAAHLRLAAQIQPRHAQSHHYLALTLIALQKPDEAEEELHAAIVQRPDFTLAHFTLGQLQLSDGRLSDAAEHFRACLRIHPESVESNSQLGTVLLAQAKYAEAKECFDAVLRNDPRHAATHAALGLMLALQGDWDRAREHLDKAVPTSAEARYTLAWLLQERGQNDAAKAEYRKAVAQDSKWPAVAAREAWLLATQPDPQNRNGKLALQRAKAACAATGDREVAFIDALAAAQAEVGDHTAAAASVRRAIQLAGDKDKARVERLAMRLQLYENGKPFREADAKQPTKSWATAPVQPIPNKPG
jgi:protein O-mannosyl-transferase